MRESESTKKTACPICAKDLRRGCCFNCGYDESADFLAFRTLQPTCSMDILARWTHFAGLEIRRGTWRPSLDREEMAGQFSALFVRRKEKAFLLDEGGRRLLRFLGGEMTPIVPEGVEEIAEKAFMDARIEGVVLPDTLRVIGSNAFAGASMRALSLPARLQVLGTQAFRNSSLENIVIPGSVKEIGNTAFLGCRKLRSVVVGPGVERIGAAAFSSCNALESIVIPDSVADVASYAFYHCPKLRIEASARWRSAHPSLRELFAQPLSEAPAQIPEDENAGFMLANGGKVIREYTGTKLVPVVPEGVSVIGKHAFAGKNVESIKLPKSLRVIENGAFRDSFLERIDLPEGLKELQSWAFKDTALKSIEIPGSVREIGEGAFYDCKALKSVRLRHGVKTIRENAFSNCTALQTIEIPDSVTEVGEYAFYNDPALRIVASDSWKVLHSNLAKLFYK